MLGLQRRNRGRFDGIFFGDDLLDFFRDCQVTDFIDNNIYKPTNFLIIDEKTEKEYREYNILVYGIDRKDLDVKIEGEYVIVSNKDNKLSIKVNPRYDYSDLAGTLVNGVLTLKVPVKKGYVKKIDIK
jgi:HSP20 family molecular chaperone IbpA